MKFKNLLLAATFVVATFTAFAQAPQRFNYQAVARNSGGNVLANQNVGIQITIHQTTPGGTTVYAETHATTTSNIGLMNLAIGGGTVTSGTFSSIDWSAGPYYIEIGMDATGGTTYTSMGTQQLLSVPYALYAGNSFSGDYNDLINAPTNVSAFTNDAGYITNPDDADADPNNENQTVTAGTGITVTQVGQNYQVTNAAPDQTVTLTQGGSTTITGTYPNFTISSTDNVNDADADPTNENQTVTAGTGVSVTQVGQDFQVTNTAPDQTVTLTQGGSTTITGTYPNFTISSTDNVNDADADPNNENQTVSAGTGISVVQVGQNYAVTNSAPDQTVTLTGGGFTSITGTYPNFTISSTGDADSNPTNENQTVSAGTGISVVQVGQNFAVTNSAPDQTVALTAGTGIGVSGTYPNFTVTNSAPDQTVALTAGTGIGVSGTYPNFTITNTSSGLTGSGTANFMTKFTGATSVGNSLMQDNGTNLSVNNTPNPLYTMYVYKQQLTATGDGQASIYGYRTRDSQNDGTGYSQIAVNSATTGYNFWGDVYTFGVSGFNYNDYNRCGGTLGADVSGVYWGSLGYRSSGSVNFGVYGSSGYASGAGYLPTTGMAGVGGGFFGDMVGSISKGKVVGQFNSGELFAAYNIGDVYTSGKNIEMVTSGDSKVPAYTVTSTEVTVYKKGKAQLTNGTAYIRFDANYSNLLGDAPVVTVTPMGACNGVYISSVDKTGFTIKEQNGGNSNVEISWIAVGDRIDATNMNEVPAVLKTNTFDNNIQNVLFDDSNKEGSGQGFWWDGTTIQFGKIPAELSPKPKTEGTQK